jgi:hypothetical protein
MSAVAGGLLVIPLRMLVRANDGGDDGWGIVWIGLKAVSGVLGTFFSARWARKRYRDFQP